MKDKKYIIGKIAEVFASCEGNTIPKEIALDESIAGVSMFEMPLIGFGSAKDPLFQEFKKPEVVGPWYMGPEEWMSGAKTVVSLFFPFTERVKNDNRKCTEGPANIWLHGRIEGQAFLTKFMNELSEVLRTDGVENCVPSNDTRFRKLMAGNMYREYECVTEKSFGSNWSERHTAFLCGLGTFGLSKGIITKKGMAGRFMSIIIDVELEPDERPYTEIYEYCTKCGACIRRCPVHAITLEEGKNHTICSDWLSVTTKMYNPRFGCGLCQTKVPCESQIP